MSTLQQAGKNYNAPTAAVEHGSKVESPLVEARKQHKSPTVRDEDTR